MSLDTGALLVNVRAEAAAPGAVLVVVRDSSRSAALFPEDIVGKSDDELAEFIFARLDQQ